MSSALSPSSVPPPGRIREEGVCDVTLRSVKPGRPWCPGGRVLRVLRSDRFPIILSTAPKHRNNKSGNGKARGAKLQSIPPVQSVMTSKSDLVDSKVLCARPDLMCSRTLKVLFVRKGYYAWQQPGGGIRGKECRLLPHPATSQTNRDARAKLRI
jgi:hypothetical protein